MKNNKVAVKVTGFISMILLMSIAWSCENVKEYTDPKDNIPPGKVTAVEIKNLHGGAEITYTLPPDDDLLGVKAVYRLREDGKEYEVFSSAFRSTIIMEGFPDTKEHIVNLYTIDLSRNVSEPVPVTIKPLTPPVDLIRNSLKVIETFGGVYCSWENILNEDIAVSLFVDSIGEMILDDTYFSNASIGSYPFRGFPHKELSFRIEIRDRWMNYSIPLDTLLTPLFEQQIKGRDDAGVQQWFLWGYANRECLSRGCNWETSGTQSNFTVLFDDILFNSSNWFESGANFGMLRHFVPGWTGDAYGHPAYFSIDMGRSASYSRMKVYMRAREPLFSSGVFSEFELWGTNNPKPLIPEVTEEDRLANLRYWTAWEEIEGTDEWKNDWVKLGEYSLVLPSGATTSTDVITVEDEDFIRNGFEYIVDVDKCNIPCRYIRIVIKKSNIIQGLRPFNQMGELQFFGSYAN